MGGIRLGILDAEQEFRLDQKPRQAALQPGIEIAGDPGPVGRRLDKGGQHRLIHRPAQDQPADLGEEFGGAGIIRLVGGGWQAGDGLFLMRLVQELGGDIARQHVVGFSAGAGDRRIRGADGQKPGDADVGLDPADDLEVGAEDIGDRMAIFVLGQAAYLGRAAARRRLAAAPAPGRERQHQEGGEPDGLSEGPHQPSFLNHPAIAPDAAPFSGPPEAMLALSSALGWMRKAGTASILKAVEIAVQRPVAGSG